jgi:hypothetical protein
MDVLHHADQTLRNGNAGKPFAKAIADISSCVDGAPARLPIAMKGARKSANAFFTTLR